MGTVYLIFSTSSKIRSLNFSGEITKKYTGCKIYLVVGVKGEKYLNFSAKCKVKAMNTSYEKYIDKSEQYPILYLTNSECCGCTACFAICPKSAISMFPDEEGFEYPEIDHNKCIKCYQCLKVCPYKTIE